MAGENRASEGYMIPNKQQDQNSHHNRTTRKHKHWNDVDQDTAKKKETLFVLWETRKQK